MANRTCFLIAPIGPAGSEVRERSELVFTHIVRPAAEASGYELVRADQINVPGPITGQIVRLLLDVEVVVADISGLNPNVMYELGIRHAADDPPSSWPPKARRFRSTSQISGRLSSMSHPCGHSRRP